MSSHTADGIAVRLPALCRLLKSSTGEQYAAEELAYHIQKVSGAEVTVTNTASADSLPIVIGTPTTVPELETLFPDDLAWLRTLSEESPEGGVRRYGDDGFAIRAHDGKLYIFGAVSRGALNGVYDFIEENLGVLWIRAAEDIGLFYDEMPTVTAEKVNYREKSPFAVRSLSQYGSAGSNANYPEAIRLYSRNKYNFSPKIYSKHNKPKCCQFNIWKKIKLLMKRDRKMFEDRAEVKDSASDSF